MSGTYHKANPYDLTLRHLSLLSHSLSYPPSVNLSINHPFTILFPITYPITLTLLSMEAFELKYCKGRWLAPLGFVDEIYEALLRLPAQAQTDYITLGSNDSDVEIYCATKQSKILKEPFAYTEEQAKGRLSIWLEEEIAKRRNVADVDNCDQGTNTSSQVASPTAAKSVPNPSFPTTEAEAVRYLRERGYAVALPYLPTGYTGSITPPPPYTKHLSSSQPTNTVAGDKRKRSSTRLVDRASSCPSTPARGSCNGANRAGATNPTLEVRDSDDDGDDEDGGIVARDDASDKSIDKGKDNYDDDDDDDEEEEEEEEEEDIRIPMRKKPRTVGVAKVSRLQKPTTPPRCRKTKKSNLSTVLSHEAAAELIDSTLPVDTEMNDEDGKRYTLVSLYRPNP